MTEFRHILEQASSGPLSKAMAEEAFSGVMEGKATPVQMAALLMAIRTRGESIDEIQAAAGVMRRMCNKVRAPAGSIDIVGTGGDGKRTLNISTAAAIVVAGAGVPVAKHGNRNLSSQSGSADVLGQMGVNVMVGADIAQRAIDEAGICFMMAPMHHPAMRNVMPVRTDLGIRTVFNILGPLTNPAGVKCQLTGAYSAELLIPMARVLQALGSERAWLVHGSDGTDELSICGSTSVVQLLDDGISEFEVHPGEAGLDTSPIERITGGTPAENARAFRAMLAGRQSAYRDAVLLNSAAALVISQNADDLREGVMIASDSIDSGKALAKVEKLATLTSS